jgi:hypothetical protein
MRLVVIGLLPLLAGGCERETGILAAREMRAIRWMGIVNSAEEAYFTANGRYCGSLSALAEAESSPFLRDDPKRNHYIVSLRATTSGYETTAIPDSTNASSYAMRSFFSDETSIIRYSNTAEPAGKKSPEIQ